MTVEEMTMLMDLIMSKMLMFSVANFFGMAVASFIIYIIVTFKCKKSDDEQE